MASVGVSEEVRTRGVPRGPDEWGKLLFEPPVSRMRKARGPRGLVPGLVFIALGIVFLVSILAIQTYGVDEFGEDATFMMIMFLLMPGYFMAVGVYSLFRWRLELPLRVYEAGVTNPSPPLLHRLREGELLIPSEDIGHIGHSTYLAMSFKNERGVNKHFTHTLVDQKEIDDFFSAVHKVAPHALEDSEWLKRAKRRGLIEAEPEELDSIQQLTPSYVPRRLPRELLADRGRVIQERNVEDLVREEGLLRRDVMVQLLVVISYPAIVIACIAIVGWVGLIVGVFLLMLYTRPITFLIENRAFSRLVPVTVYENGIEAKDFLGRVQFIPWGVFSGWDENPESLTFERLRDLSRPSGFLQRRFQRPMEGVLVLTGGRQFVNITPSFPDYERVVAMVRERVDIDRYVTEGFVDKVTSTLFGIGLVTTLLSVAIAWSLAYWSLQWFKIVPSVTGHAIVMMAVPITMALLAVMTYAANHPFLWYNLVLRPPLKVPAIVVVLMLVLFGAASTTGWDETWRPLGEGSATIDPGDSRLEPGSYHDAIISAWGPVNVHEGEELRLVNSTLEFIPDPWGDYGIWVGKGGRLVLENSTVRSFRFREGYTFEVQGSASIRGCLFEDLAVGDPEAGTGGGMEVFTDDVVISGSRFLSASGSAITVQGASPLIEDCSISNALHAGVEVHGGGPSIANCSFVRCLIGIDLWGSDAEIERCYFCETGTGIISRWSEPRISDCTFRWILETAIKYTGVDRPSIVNSSYLNNVTKTEMRMAVTWSEVACPVVVLVAVIMVTSLLLNLNRRWRVTSREDEEDGNTTRS